MSWFIWQDQFIVSHPVAFWYFVKTDLGWWLGSNFVRTA